MTHKNRTMTDLSTPAATAPETAAQGATIAATLAAFAVGLRPVTIPTAVLERG